jgi:hypothetical protein
MTIFEFETQYTTEWVDQYGTKRLFMPRSAGRNTGAMFTTNQNGFKIGGEYGLYQENNNIYLELLGQKFLFSPTNEGFKLSVGNIDHYYFRRSV